jgi:hypothetical protein
MAVKRLDKKKYRPSVLPRCKYVTVHTSYYLLCPYPCSVSMDLDMHVSVVIEYGHGTWDMGH